MNGFVMRVPAIILRIILPFIHETYHLFAQICVLKSANVTPESKFCRGTGSFTRLKPLCIHLVLHWANT
jgi:hypothetical protein